MANTISFFSSDSRPLYKKDVFNSICYPDRYVIHFRYKEKYISPEILKNLEELNNREGIIFLAIAQNAETGHLTSATLNISVRSVSILKVEKSEDTGHIHFYLELRDFKDCSFNEQTYKSIIPPNFYVTELPLQIGNKNSLHERIEKIKGAFPDQLFTKVDIVNRKSRELIYPVFEQVENTSIYELTDETEYALKIAFIHTGDIVNKDKDKIPVLKIEDKANQIQVNSEEYIDIGANYDDRIFKMITKSIMSSKDASYLKFKIQILDKSQDKIEKTVQDFSLPIRIKKKISNVILFGVFSVLAISSLGFLALFQASLKDGAINYTYLALSASFAFISSALLYNMFNKK